METSAGSGVGADGGNPEGDRLNAGHGCSRDDWTALVARSMRAGAGMPDGDAVH